MTDLPPPNWPYPQPQYWRPPRERNGLATATLVVGIVGAFLFFVPVIGFVLGLVAIGLGVGAVLGPIRRGTSRATLRTAFGIALGSLTIVGNIVAFMAYDDAADDIDRWDRCADRLPVTTWDRCDKFLDGTN